MSRPERQHRRYAHEAAITLIVPGATIEGRTRDVSRGGLCALLSEQLAVGTDIELDIQLVFDDDRQSEPLRLPARVVWCTPVDEHHQVGLQFRRLVGETAEYLTMFLRYLDGDARTKPTARATTIDERFG